MNNDKLDEDKLETVIFLDKKTLFLMRPSQVKLVPKINGTYLEAIGEADAIEVSPEQLVNDFSGLKRERDVEAFAYKYGKLHDEEEKLEAVNEWLEIASLVRKILELRKAFLKNKSLSEIIGFGETHFIWISDNSELITPLGEFEEAVWIGAERLSLKIKVDSDIHTLEDIRSLVPLLIKNEILPFIDVRLDYAEAEIIADLVVTKEGYYTYREGFDPTNTRFSFKGRKYAPNLLSAIFYSLRDIVNSDRDIHECEECKRPTIIRRQRDHIYCGGACKKKAERKRKENSVT